MSHPVDKPLILVDGSSYLYRAFYALPPLTNARGEPTGAVYGVLSMLRKLLEKYQPEHMAVVFDAKGKTFRDELFEQYKAHRSPMPDDLKVQIEPLHALVRANGWPLLVIEGVEADDVIGTLARQATALGMCTVISTGDKDMAQLVNEQVIVINTMNGSMLDRAGVEEKFGVPPESIIDYLALVGDSSDNIPGVPQVGPKTAAKWLKAYGSLDHVMACANEITGKVGENLRAHLNQLQLARRLATIHCDIALPRGPLDLRITPPNKAVLAEWFQHLEFKTWLSQLHDESVASPAAARSSIRYETILTEEALADWLKRLHTAELISFDTETTSLDYMKAEIVGVSFAVKPGEAAYVPLAHDYAESPAQLPREQVLARLRPLLEDPHKPKLGHNLKYDMHVLANHGIALRGVSHDSMLESYVLNSVASRHDMDSLAKKYLDYHTVTYEEVAGKGTKQLSFNQVPIERAAHYASEDAEVTLRLHHHFWPRLHQEEKLQILYQGTEIPLVEVIAQMERTGVLINAELLRQQSQEQAQKQWALEAQAHRLAGEKFNLGSPKQLQELLYEKLRLPISYRTPTGQPSTSEDALQELVRFHPLAEILLEHRVLSKLKSTYTDQLPERINPHTGRVHTSYHQAVTATGRLSSSDPNLQNIPIRTPEGRRIRQAFIASPGHVIVAADYSQIELRIMAHLSRDRRLLSAFQAESDVHTATAAEIFALSPEEVTSEQRRHAKAINFGLIYGMSAFGLARQLGLEREAAQQYIDLYFARYPGVKDYMEHTREQSRNQGYVETVFGRRLYLPDIQAKQYQRRQYAERAAVNAPMQGTAADIIKRAMLSAYVLLKREGLSARMIMQVHDELVFEVATEELKDTTALIRHSMVEAASLSVPLVVEIGAAPNWDLAH